MLHLFSTFFTRLVIYNIDKIKMPIAQIKVSCLFQNQTVTLHLLFIVFFILVIIIFFTWIKYILSTNGYLQN